MENPFRGEVELIMNGSVFYPRLTLGALASLENSLKVESLFDLIDRFETKGVRSQDVILVLCAGLIGAGHNIHPHDIENADISGGPAQAVKIASLLLLRAFSFDQKDEK